MKKRDPPEDLGHPTQAGEAEDRFPEDTAIRAGGFELAERFKCAEPMWTRVGEHPQLRHTQREAAVIAAQVVTDRQRLARAKVKAAAYYGQE